MDSKLSTDSDSKKIVASLRHVTMVGFWINAALVVLKLFFGYWGHSDALVADGYHSVSDFLTDFLVLFFVGIAYKKADSDHPYGHGKFETIASVGVSAVLVIVAFFIGFEGVKTIIDSLHGVVIPRPDVWTIVVAIVAILAKEYCYRYTIAYGRKYNSSSIIANAWHHRSDALSSIATLIGVSISFFFGENWRILDPIASVIIALFIFWSAIKIAMPSINELLEKSVPEDEVQNIRNLISEVRGVENVHNLRCRNNGHSLIIDVNIHVNPDITVKQGHEIATAVEDNLKGNLGKDLIIYIHIEPEET